MRMVFAALSGALFGTGLWMSGMTDTTKVQGWLDIFGAWDPTLAFVMGGAIVPMALAWRLTRARNPALGGLFPPPPEAKVGRNLVIGSIMFGFGWGLAGLCPGPSIAALSWGGWEGLAFAVAMVAGMWAAPGVRSRLDAMVPVT